MPDSLENATLDEVLDHVGPGKLIRSDVFTWMLERIRDLEERVGDDGGRGRVVVPNLTGRSLSSALAIINSDALSLRLGPVLDIDGLSVNARSIENGSRIVLMQMPPADGRVASNSLVRLLVTEQAETPVPAPSIDDLVPNPVRVNEFLTIQGSDFPSTWRPDLGDAVTFNGTEGDVETGSSNTQALQVRVPEGISGVPEEGDDEVEVTLTVQVRSETAQSTVRVQPSVGQEPIQITGIRAADNTNPTTGEAIVIVGTGFSDTLDENIVTFDPADNDLQRAAEARVSDGIQVLCPSAADLGFSGTFGRTDILVTVNGVPSNTLQNEAIVVGA
jgi:hypothetical protein